MNKPIEIFVRHCNTSANSAGKQRPEWFSREKCWVNLLNSSSPGSANITAIFDGSPAEEHFIKKQQDRHFTLVELPNGGDDGRSFLNMLNYVKSLNLDDETIVYFVEDDYLHVPGWQELILELFTNMNVDYGTLYDHNDKYFLSMYEGLQSSILVTPSCHWRTTPSTTNTYFCKWKILKRDFDIHVKFCDLEKGYTRDHDKFTFLWQNGSNLVSSLPGYSTHVETQYLSPCINWVKI